MTALGAYTLDAVAGRGGMATVWRARHVARDLVVAVKVLDAERAAHPRFRAAFRHEARAVAALDHPNVVVVHDLGVVPAGHPTLPEGSPYLVMAWAETTLRERPPQDWRGLRAALHALLAALAHAHARGVVHRDVKPANVLAGPGGALWLADFGIAWIGEDPDDPAAGRIAGTPRYMAPEACVRGGPPLGAWTDLYALGCVAWELATGAPIHGGDEAEVLAAQLAREPGSFAPRFGVPSDFERWLRRLVAKRPRDRYETAADARFALDALGEVGGRSRDDGSVATADAFGAAPTLDALTAPTEDPQAEWGEPSARGSARVETPPFPESEPPVRAAPPLVGAGLGLHGLRTLALVGRAAERALMWRTLARVHAIGAPAAIVLTGPAGCGKSRLATWLGEEAAELGVGVALRAAYAAEPGPVAGLTGLVRAWLGPGNPARNAVERIGEGDAASDAARLARDGGAGWSAGERTAGWINVLAGIAEARPAVVVFDDAPWSADAVGLARGALHRGRPAALFVLVARDDDLARNPEVARQLAALCARADVSAVALGPLPESEHRMLVQERLGLRGDVGVRVAAHTQGNPLFAMQLVADWIGRGWLSAGPEGFAAAAEATDRLPDDLHALWRGRVDQVLASRSAADARALDSLRSSAIGSTPPSGARRAGRSGSPPTTSCSAPCATPGWAAPTATCSCS